MRAAHRVRRVRIDGTRLFRKLVATILESGRGLVAPVQVQVRRPESQTEVLACRVGTIAGQHVFAFSFHEVAHMRTMRVGPLGGGGYCSLEIDDFAQWRDLPGESVERGP